MQPHSPSIAVWVCWLCFPWLVPIAPRWITLCTNFLQGWYGAYVIFLNQKSYSNTWRKKKRLRFFLLDFWLYVALFLFLFLFLKQCLTTRLRLSPTSLAQWLQGRTSTPGCKITLLLFKETLERKCHKTTIGCRNKSDPAFLFNH